MDITLQVELKNPFSCLDVRSKEKDALSSLKVGRCQILTCERHENNQDIFCLYFLLSLFLKLLSFFSSITV